MSDRTVCRDRASVLLPFLAASWIAGCGLDGAIHETTIEGDRQPPWFEPMQSEWNILFTYESGATGRYLFPETVGGGAATVDLTGNGLLDIYLVQGGCAVGSLDPAPGNRLFHQVALGEFTDVSDGSGADDRGYGMGVAAGDLNNNGSLDLYVTNLGRNSLLRNRGDGRFDDITIASGTGDEGWGTSASFVDINLNGQLDLFVVNYIIWTPQIEQPCTLASGLRTYCTPNAYEAPAPDVLLRNNGDETFTDISIGAGLHTAYGNGLGVVCSDLNLNGHIDIFVANDQMPNQLWINRGNETFEESAQRLGCAVDGSGRAKAGMGVAALDWGDTGREDLFVVNLTRETDTLYRNHGTHFADETVHLGFASVSRRYTRFGVGFYDFNNNGHLDLYQANGRVTQAGQTYSDDPYAEPNLLLRGLEIGRFEAVEPIGGTSQKLLATSRAAAFGDLNNDGKVDIVVVNRDASVHVLLNVAQPDPITEPANWIMFRLIDENGRDAYNAVLVVSVGDRTVHRTVRSAHSYMAANDPRVHIGLGRHEMASNVRIRWLDGTEQVLGDYAANQIVTIRR